MGDSGDKPNYTFWEQNNSLEDYKMDFNHQIPPATVTVSYEEYEKLLKDQAVLKTLRDHGVEDWQGYEKAIDSI